MAGYSLSSPVTPSNNKHRRHSATPSRRTSHIFNNMNIHSASKGSNSKVIKTKTRLKPTFKSSDRQMYFKNYFVPQIYQPKSSNSNNQASRPSLSSSREMSFFSNERTTFPDRFENAPFGLVDIIKSKGLNAIAPVRSSSQYAKPSFSTPISNGFIPNQTETKMDINGFESYKSKVGLIQENWNLPEKSNIFKNSMENRLDLIYPSKDEKIVHNNINTIRDGELVEKLNSLPIMKSGRKSISNTIRSFISTGITTAFNFKHALRQFIPFRQQDYEISEKAHVEREDKLPPLTQDMENELTRLFRSPNQMICTAFSINIHTKDLITLCGSNWLNDAVIEFYLNLVASRSQESNKFPSVYTFGTFFFTRLSKGSALGRWANKLDFFSYDILIVPIHAASHWRLAIVDNVNKSIEYYDSLGLEFRQCIDLLANFMQNESLNKKKEKLDMSQWTLKYKIPDIPLQNNSYDCGVFTCKYAEYIARRKSISFTQENIQYFRKCMIYEIIHKQLLIN